MMAWKRSEVIVEHDDREESSFSLRRSALLAARLRELQGRLPPLISTCGDTLSGGPMSSPSNTRYRFSVGRLPAGRERSRLAKDTENGGSLMANVSFACMARKLRDEPRDPSQLMKLFFQEASGITKNLSSTLVKSSFRGSIYRTSFFCCLSIL